MTITQQTTIQAYQLNKGGTRARMAILRMVAAESKNNGNPHTRLAAGDWKAARTYTLGNYQAAYSSGLNQGLNDGKPVWYSHHGEIFRNERHAHKIVRTRHTGYYTDTECDGLAIGIVAGLTHGKFIAGYTLTDSCERVYFHQVFDDEDDAARMADEHARIIGERAMEDAEQYNAARDVESSIDDMRSRLLECLALRHRTCMDYVRDEARTLCESIRNAQQTLRTDYANYI